MKARIHEGHLGIERCKAPAREVLFWPGMATDAVKLVFSREKDSHENLSFRSP